MSDKNPEITPRFSLPKLKFFHGYATNPPSLKALESSRDKSRYQLEEARADKHLALEQPIKLQAGRNLCQSKGAWAGNVSGEGLWMSCSVTDLCKTGPLLLNP